MSYKSMKSSILCLVSLCAMSLGLASCSSNDDLESAKNNVIAQNVAKYGTRSSDVTLYFGGGTIAATRAADVNGNMWGDLMPAYPTQEEKDGVLAYVRENPGAKVDWPGYTN